MPKLDQIRDVETLKTVASLLEKTVIDQQKTIAKLKTEIATLRGDAVPAQLELDLLKEQLAALQRKVFASSSEQRPAPKEDTPSRPQRGHGPSEQPRLPISEQVHTLPEDQQICPACDGHVVPMGEQFEESEEITVVQASYQVVTHKRQKYRCTCNGAVVTAPGPPKLIPGGRYSPEFAVHVAEAKYLDHMPLERQARAMKRRGLEVTGQALWDQVFALSRWLVPTYEALCRQALAAEVAFVDETYWRVMEQDSRAPWWVWCVTTDDAAAYWIRSKRSHEAAAEVLGSFQGVLMSDGYAVYEALARGSPGITPVHCWAHVRRKFIEAESSFPQECQHAVDLIGELYAVEREAPFGNRDGQAEILALRRRLRHERSRPVIDALREWAYATKPAVLPRSSLGKALAYMLSLWPGLTAFLENPRVPLDNNAAERALRGVVVGRKNHYGSHSRRGAETAAMLYTLFESAKLADVDPHAYVLEATRRAIANPGAVTLPHELS